MQILVFQKKVMGERNHDSQNMVFNYLSWLSSCSGLSDSIVSNGPNFIDIQSIGTPKPPSLSHWFGTDDLGRDILLRSIYGARISLMVGFVAVGISLLIGLAVGLISGFLGGVMDAIIMRLIDVLMALPSLFLILMIQVTLDPSIINVMVVIGVTSWMGMARLVRAEVLSIKERTFVTACRARD